jgi:hypothetical protein
MKSAVQASTFLRQCSQTRLKVYQGFLTSFRQVVLNILREKLHYAMPHKLADDTQCGNPSYKLTSGL